MRNNERKREKINCHHHTVEKLLAKGEKRDEVRAREQVRELRLNLLPNL